MATSSDPIDFKVFWAAYPRKVCKKDAARAWQKIGPDARLAETIVSAIYAQRLADREVRYIPHPATWLNGERWTDDVANGPRGRVVGTEPEWRAHCPHQPRCLVVTTCAEAWAWLKSQVLSA